MECPFTPDNTEWLPDEAGNAHLCYVGDVDDLSVETGISVPDLYEMLDEYEKESRDLIDTQREINEAKKGQY